MRKRYMGARAVALMCGCAALIGCTGAPPRIGAEAAGARAAGVEGAIEFRVQAAPVDEPREMGGLTMSEAVRLAVMGDPGIQAALARARVALADAKQARLLPNPIVSIAVRFAEAGGKPLIEASLAQDLVSVLKRPREASAADKRLRAASAAAVEKVIDVVAEVQERFVTVQAKEALLASLRERGKFVEKGRLTAHVRLDAGEGTRDDVLVLESAGVTLAVEIAQTEQELRDERLRLTRMIGQPSGRAEWKIEAWKAEGFEEVAEKEWIAAGLRSRPEIQEKMWELAALGDEAVSVQLLAFEGSGAGLEVQRNENWEIGPSFSVAVPIFDTGEVRREKAQAERVAARHELVQTKRQVIEDVRRAHAALVHNRANAELVRTKAIPMQEERRRLAEIAFRAGERDATELYLAEGDLRAMRTKLVELELEIELAAIRLQRAVGGPGPAGELTREDFTTEAQRTQR